MPKSFLILSLLSFCFAGQAAAQRSAETALFSADRRAENTFELKGVVRDETAAVISGLTVYFHGGGKAFFISTGTDGRFVAHLPAGRYSVTVTKLVSESFSAELDLKTRRNRPKTVEYVVKTNPVCCGTSAEKPYPKIIRLSTPKYPAAAVALRAHGEVTVKIVIDKEGRVVSAEAVGGHPLLRSASVQAARQAEFEPGENGARTVYLTFVYLLAGQEKQKQKRYSNPYRFEVVSDPAVLNIQ